MQINENYGFEKLKIKQKFIGYLNGYEITCQFFADCTEDMLNYLADTLENYGYEGTFTKDDLYKITEATVKTVEYNFFNRNANKNKILDDFMYYAEGIILNDKLSGCSLNFSLMCECINKILRRNKKAYGVMKMAIENV